MQTKEVMSFGSYLEYCAACAVLERIGTAIMMGVVTEHDRKEGRELRDRINKYKKACTPQI
jgi:hypothetical protein